MRLFSLFSVVLLLAGCMSPGQRFTLEQARAGREAVMVSHMPAAIEASRTVFKCNDCREVELIIAADQDSIAAIVEGIVPEQPVNMAEAGRDVGIAFVKGLFAPTSAMVALGAVALEQAGDNERTFNTNSFNQRESETWSSLSSSRSVSASATVSDSNDDNRVNIRDAFNNTETETDTTTTTTSEVPFL